MAEQTWIVTSPNGQVQAELIEDGESELTLLVSGRGHRVLNIDQLGRFTDAADSAIRSAVFGRTDRGIDEEYQTTTGKRLRHQHRAQESTFLINAGDHGLELDVRVADDGVAYRHRWLGTGPAKSSGEPGRFVVDPDAPVWLSPYRVHYEGLWRGGSAVRELPAGTEFGFPALFELGADSWCLLTEAAVDETYAASRLVTEAEGQFRLLLPQDQIRSELPWTTPWRVAIIGGLSDVVQSSLVTDLNPPCRLDDTSWIRPGRAAWSWWSEFYSPRDPDRQRDYIDYAAKHSWEFVLVDARWDLDWLPDLVSYAADLGVAILIWSHWRDLATQAQRDELLPLWSSWGVAGIKVDFMESDVQERMAWYEALARDAAEHRLMINYHGCTLPKGRERTWPHVMTYEGIRGAEHQVRLTGPDGWSFRTIDGPDPVHNTIVPFTRNVVGSMDYTPVTFTHGYRSTTPAHELALAVIFESGWQHFADSIEAYAARPIAETFLSGVPTVWDETRLLAGYPGRFVVLARRREERWYVAAIAAGLPRQVTLRCDFLAPGTAFDAESIEDAPDQELTRRTVRVTAVDTLTLHLTDNGGFAATFSPTRDHIDLSIATKLTYQ